MSIQSEITRLKNAVSATYTAASGKGAVMPSARTSDNLASCITSITASVSGTTLVLPFGSVSSSNLSL